MTVELSKGLVDNMAAGDGAVNISLAPAITISFGDGTGAGATDEILDSGNNLGSFHVGDQITTITTSTTNDITTEILTVAAGSIEVAAGSFATEAAGQQVALASARGHSLKDIFRYSVMRLYATPRPASVQDTEGVGTLLLEISDAGGAFSGGSDTNGLLFDAVVDGVLTKLGSQVWSDTVIATGTLVWGRLYDNGFNTGADGSEIFNRIDFDAGAAGDLVMSASLTLGTVKTIDEFSITIPLT